jgi:hypothetical protein
MSIQVTYPAPTNLPRIKQFFWDVKDRRTVERGIGGIYNNDTTQVTTTSTTRVNLKSYTWTVSAYVNKVRIRVYGYGNGGGTTWFVSVNGTDVTPSNGVATTNTSNALVVDVIASLNPSASNTINVDGAVSTSGYTLYLTQVIIIAGFGLTSTTSVSILSITLDSANDVYTLNVSGNFVYKVGIRWWVKGNRKTTASASITSSLANEIQGSYSPSAGDDGDNNALITVRTGDYATSFSISGYVGATGDTIIITAIYCQIILRANNADSLSTWKYWELLIEEKGIMSVVSRHVTIDASSQFAVYQVITKNGSPIVYQSSSGSDVIVGNLIFSVNDAPEYAWHISWSDDNLAKALFLYVNIIVIGV